MMFERLIKKSSLHPTPLLLRVFLTPLNVKGWKESQYDNVLPLLKEECKFQQDWKQRGICLWIRTSGFGKAKACDVKLVFARSSKTFWLNSFSWAKQYWERLSMLVGDLPRACLLLWFSVWHLSPKQRRHVSVVQQGAEGTCFRMRYGSGAKLKVT